MSIRLQPLSDTDWAKCGGTWINGRAGLCQCTTLRGLMYTLRPYPFRVTHIEDAGGYIDGSGHVYGIYLTGVAQ